MSYFGIIGPQTARPIVGRTRRPIWRGVGEPPATHQLINEDAGTPAVGGDLLEIMDRFNSVIIDRAGNSIYSRA